MRKEQGVVEVQALGSDEWFLSTHNESWVPLAAVLVARLQDWLYNGGSIIEQRYQRFTGYSAFLPQGALHESTRRIESAGFNPPRPL